MHDEKGRASLTEALALKVGPVIFDICLVWNNLVCAAGKSFGCMALVWSGVCLSPNSVFS